MSKRLGKRAAADMTQECACCIEDCLQSLLEESSVKDLRASCRRSGPLSLQAQYQLLECAKRSSREDVVSWIRENYVLKENCVLKENYVLKVNYVLKENYVLNEKEEVKKREVQEKKEFVEDGELLLLVLELDRRLNQNHRLLDEMFARAFKKGEVSVLKLYVKSGWIAARYGSKAEWFVKSHEDGACESHGVVCGVFGLENYLRSSMYADEGTNRYEGTNHGHDGSLLQSVVKGMIVHNDPTIREFIRSTNAAKTLTWRSASGYYNLHALKECVRVWGAETCYAFVSQICNADLIRHAMEEWVLSATSREVRRFVKDELKRDEEYMLDRPEYTSAMFCAPGLLQHIDSWRYHETSEQKQNALMIWMDRHRDVSTASLSNPFLEAQESKVEDYTREVHETLVKEGDLPDGLVSWVIHSYVSAVPYPRLSRFVKET